MNINEPELLMKRFDLTGRVIAKYARAIGVQETALRRVLNGDTNGSRARKEGETRKIFKHLKADGIWIGRLPWEDKSKSKKVA